jgi:hypothetical protein
MPVQLNPNILNSVTAILSPTATPRGNFGTLLILGDSNVISGAERLREYADLTSVALDFGTSAAEYLAANLYFAQSPKPPASLFIGRWLRTATAAFAKGGTLSSAEQLMSAWTTVTNGSVKFTIDGTARSATSLNFSAATTLTGVAALITTGLTGGVVTWNGSQFIVTSSTTGASSTISYATVPASGSDIGPQLKMTADTNAVLTQGYAAETPVAAVSALITISNQWYGCTFAASTMPTDAQVLAVASTIEASNRIYGVASSASDILDAGSTSDLASSLKALLTRRTLIQYSGTAYAIVSFLARAFVVDFNGSNTTLTMMYKQEPLIVAENLTSTQASTLKTKRCNVYAAYSNGAFIVQYGMMSGPVWFDEQHGLDWLVNAIETDVFNLFYNNTTKIPQTNSGVNQVLATIAKTIDGAVRNGFVAAGVWDADGFGQIERGDYLDSGYYLFSPPINDQSSAERTARTITIQAAIKLAGAIQQCAITLNVNR